MLPPSPLHLLLAGDLGRPLVMTSGNRTDEPTVHLDQQAVDRLADIADGILAHDRAIEVRVDDSVVRASAGGRVQVLRRSRGWVPQPLRLPTPAVEPILAVGAELKNTVAVARGPDVVVGHHLGDLRHWAAYESFLHAVGHLPRLSGVQPTVIAHDLHPEYLSTKWALEQDARRVAVQHHHAHLAACLVEHGRADPVVGIVFDGAGFGLDGTLWGGEFLLGSLGEARRVGQLAAVVLPGGDTAVRQPWRMAVSWLWAALPAGQAAEHARELDPRWRGVLALVEAGHGVATSSVGRLFDAVAALLHVAHTVTYEGQAAIALEELAATATRVRRYRIDCPDRVLDPRPLLRALLRDRQAGIPAADIAAGFHAALARASAELAAEIAAAHAVDTVALCGGVFANVLLSDLLARELHRRGLQVLSHASLPPGDGSISVGQAAVAAARGTADRSPAPPAHPPATEASAPS